MTHRHCSTAVGSDTGNRVARVRSALLCLCLPTLTLLTSCTGLHTQPADSQRVFRDNSQLNQWQLRGRIGVVSDQTASSGYLNWYQCNDRFEVRINGPLGSGAVKLIGSKEQVTLYEDDKPPLTAPSAEQLLRDNFGWQLPLSQLHFWIRGIPNPDSHHRETTTGFEQVGWTLQYPRQTVVAAHTLPAKAIAENDNTRVTLVVQQWQLDPDCNDVDE